MASSVQRILRLHRERYGPRYGPRHGHPGFNVRHFPAERQTLIAVLDDATKRLLYAQLSYRDLSSEPRLPSCAVLTRDKSQFSPVEHSAQDLA